MRSLLDKKTENRDKIQDIVMRIVMHLTNSDNTALKAAVNKRVNFWKIQKRRDTDLWKKLG